MVFSSFTFIYLFLPLFLFCYFIVKKNWRNTVALFFSAMFYLWSSPEVLILLIATSYSDYLLSERVYTDDSNLSRKKMLCAFGIIINVLSLFYFKYCNFFIENLSNILSQLEIGSIPVTSIILPTGISFFTFEKISYLVDVYFNKTPPAASFGKYLLFVMLFPHLIAGPILKYHDLYGQINDRTVTKDDFFIGWTRFAFGLAKKVLIADEIGKVANTLFSLPVEDLTMPSAWLAVICYSMQLYFDFSGYSDMAIGLARMMGFRFIENFNHPYISASITEFWKRWHISLSSWMKEYLYIPLGGNRMSPFRSYWNLFIVFTLSGIWHGASWTFLFWGFFHGFFLILERLYKNTMLIPCPRPFKIAWTYLLVLLAWVLFRAENLSKAAALYVAMFDFQTASKLLPNNHYRAEIINAKGITMLCIALFLSFIPAYTHLYKKIIGFCNGLPKHTIQPITTLFAIIVFLLSTITLSQSNFSPFLYFQF
jgi:alginate O-acetyltransferase complex protein AlgI